jgi:hypothetical protein
MAESRGGATRLKVVWTAVGGVVAVGALLVVGVALAIHFLCEGTAAPPRTASGLIDPTRVCTGPGIEYDTAHGQVAAVALVNGDSVRGEIVPEKRSHRISPKDLEVGRVIARVKLLGAGTYTKFGLQDTTSACWFVKGDYPNNLVSTIYRFDGKVLVDSIQTLAKFRLHLHAEAHWEPRPPHRAALDLRPAELHADTPDSVRRRAAYALALQGVIAAGQGSCKTSGCCYPL